MVFRRKKPAEKQGLFDGLKGKGMSERFDVPLAVMIPMVAMMWADEKKDETEGRTIYALCEASPIYANHSRSDVGKLIEQADGYRLELGDKGACTKAAEALSEPLRQTAFAFAMQVLFADGKVADTEKAETEKMAAWLGLEGSLPREILKVVSILNHDRDTR